MLEKLRIFIAFFELNYFVKMDLNEILYLITINFVKSKVTLQINEWSYYEKQPYIFAYTTSNTLSEFKLFKIN